MVALLFASGCSRSDQNHQEILKTLATRTNALNLRDMTMYLSVVSRNYNDKHKNYVQLKESLENNFRDYEQLSYEPGTPTITVTGATAESVCSYRMKIKVRKKEMTLNGIEHLRLAKEPEGWKIIAGI